VHPGVENYREKTSWKINLRNDNLWFVVVSGFWLMSVATASLQDMDAEAAQAINKITEAGTNAIIDEAKSQPIKIDLPPISRTASLTQLVVPFMRSSVSQAIFEEDF
jgi:hypothetical protein